MLIVYRVLYALLQISRVDMRRKFLLDERESGRWEMGEKMERGCEDEGRRPFLEQGSETSSWIIVFVSIFEILGWGRGLFEPSLKVDDFW